MSTKKQELSTKHEPSCARSLMEEPFCYGADECGPCSCSSPKSADERADARYPNDIWSGRNGSLPNRSVLQYGKKSGFATCIREVAEPLEEWKESAIKVMGEWDKVHEALGKPGRLGDSMAAASLAEVVKLRALVQAGNVMREAIQLHMEDHVFDRIPYGTELDMNKAATAWDAAKELGFVPANTTEG